MIWKNKSREVVAVRIILLIALVIASITFITDTNLTGFTTSENMTNSLPVWNGSSVWHIEMNSDLTVNLDEYFADPDNDRLTYLATANDKIDVVIENNMLTLIPAPDFAGERTISILASDEFDAVKASVKLIIGTDEERALSPVNISVLEENISVEDVNISVELNISIEENISGENLTQEVVSNASAVSEPLEAEDNRSIKKFDKDEKIKDENNRHVGKKVEDSAEFETFFTSIQKKESGLFVEFSHNATTAQPVWIEGDIEYELSKDTAEPLENITLIVPRVKGIIPKFKLHVGSLSDIFEFGKVIPEIIFNGNSTLIDRDDDKLDILLDKESVSAEIKGIADIDLVNAKVSDISHSIIKTPVFAADDVLMDNATIILPKANAVSVIMECPDFDIDSESCPGGWKYSGIAFEQNETHVKFTVSHFSAYGGGIYVTRAQHLGSDYSFIADVYNEVKDKDSIWSNSVNNSQYVRAAFNKNITSNRVMDIMVRGSGYIEVYYPGDNNLIASSEYVNASRMVYIKMENLSYPADTFDLKTVGEYLEYDLIHDATAVTCGATLNASTEYILTADATTSTDCFTLSGHYITLDCQNFAIRGDTTTSGDYAIQNTAISGNFTMLNCFVYNFSNPMYRFFENASIHNNVFDSPYTYLYFAATGGRGDNNLVYDNNFTNQRYSSGSALYITTDNNNIYNNYFFNNTGYDIWTNGGNGYMTNNTIDANNKNKSSIYIVTTDLWTVENNTVVNQGTGADSYGYYMFYVNSPVTFIGNNDVDGENASDYFIYNRNDIEINGLSRGATNVLYPANLVIYQASNVTVRNSLIENHSENQIYFYNVENGSVEGNQLYNGDTYVVNFARVKNMSFENNTVTNGDGFNWNVIEDARIVNNTVVADAATYGIFISSAAGGDNVVVSDNYISAQNTALYVGAGSGSYLSNLNIYNNLIANSSSTGILLSESTSINRMDANVYNNTIFNCSIGISNANHNTNITNNTISDCGTSVSDAGIVVSQNANITKNSIKNCGSGIKISQTITGNSGSNIGGNILDNNTVWGIYITPTTVYDNFVNNISSDNLINGNPPYYYVYGYNPGISAVENLSMEIARGVSTGVVTMVGYDTLIVRNNSLMSNGTSSSDGLAPGFGFADTIHSVIANNTVNNTEYSVYIYSFTNNHFTNNTFINNIFFNTGSDMLGGEGTRIYNISVVNNTFRDLRGSTDYAVSLPAASLKDGNNISHNWFYNITNGIYLWGDTNIVEYNVFENISGTNGILIADDSNIIRYNNISDMPTATSRAIYLSSSSVASCSLYENRFVNVDDGIDILDGDYNVLENNTFINVSDDAVYLAGTIINSFIRYNTILNASDHGILIGDGSDTSLKNNTFENNFINISSYGIYWSGCAANNTVFNNSIYGASTTALYVSPATTDQKNALQHVFNNTACYNAQAMQFGANFGFDNINVHNNSFCIVNMFPLDRVNTTLTRLNVSFNATNVFNLTGTNCTLFIDYADLGYNESVDDNANTTIEMSSAESVGWHNLSINCTDTRDNRHILNEIEFEILSVNNAPNITQVFINSTNSLNRSNENIACWVNATDIEGDAITVYFNWYNNSVLIPVLSGSASVNTDVLASISTLASSNTTGGQEWVCEVKSYDGTVNETDWNNASINIKPACGDTITNSTSLGEDISGTGNCFVIGADDILFNCNNHALTGNGTDGAAFNFSSRNNVTIRNCSITAWSTGIYSSSSVGTDIIDNIFNNSVYDIRLIVSNNTQILNNTLYGVYGASDSDSIQLAAGSDSMININITGNTINMSPVSMNTAKTAINFVGASNYVNNLLIENNYINAHTTAVDAVGANNSVLENNTIITKKNAATTFSVAAFYGADINASTNVFKNNTVYSLYGSAGSSVGAKGLTLGWNTIASENIMYNLFMGFEAAQNTRNMIMQENNISQVYPIATTTGKAIFISNLPLANISLINNTVSNNDQIDLFVSSSQEVYIINSSIANYSFSSATVILKNSTTAQLRFLTAVTADGNNLLGNSTSDVWLGNNSVFVNSSLVSGLNVSANITLYNLDFSSSPNIYADRNDDGLFEEKCSAPVCYNLSYDSVNGIFVFNSTHFSEYKAGANQPPVHSSSPVLNSTYLTNYTTENLTVYADISDIDDDAVKNITAWYMNGTSIMVLNMPFEGGSLSGTAAGVANGTKDYSGFGNNGTVVNATWNSTGGYDGKGAYEFDGNDYINISDNHVLNFTNGTDDKPFSIVAWIKLNSSSQTGVILGKYIDSNNRDYLFYVNNGDLTIREYELGTFFYIGRTYTTDLDVGKWIHVAVGYNGSKTSAGNNLFVNGMQVDDANSEFGTYTRMKGGDAPVLIGMLGGYLLYFNGTIDDVMIFNRSISAEQVKALYDNRTDLIVSQETDKNEVWKACITPNDGTEDGAEQCSNNLTISNIPPNITFVSVNSSLGNNYTTEDITCWVNATDAENTSLIVYYNWYNNTVFFSSGFAYVSNNSLTNASAIGSSSTTAGENWTCEVKSYDGTVNETDWNNATITILPAPALAVGGGGGGGGGATRVISGGVNYSALECRSDSDCARDEFCLNNKCIKLFDVQILKVDSPVAPGEVLDFTYLMKGMGVFKGDVIIDFWAEKDGVTVISGSDVVYLDEYETKVLDGMLNLYKDMLGKYKLFVQLSYKGYSAVANRPFEVIKDAPLHLDVSIVNLTEQPLDFTVELRSNKDEMIDVKLVEKLFKDDSIAWQELKGVSFAKHHELKEFVGVLEPGRYRIEVLAYYNNILESSAFRNFEVGKEFAFAGVVSGKMPFVLSWIFDNKCFVLAVLILLAAILALACGVVYFLSYGKLRRVLVLGFVLIGIAVLLLLAKYLVCKVLLVPVVLALLIFMLVLLVNAAVPGLFRALSGIGRRIRRWRAGKKELRRLRRQRKRRKQRERMRLREKIRRARQRKIRLEKRQEQLAEYKRMREKRRQERLELERRVDLDDAVREIQRMDARLSKMYKRFKD